LAVGALALVLVIAAFFISYSHSGRSPASLVEGSPRHTSNGAAQQILFVPTKSENGAPLGNTTAVGMEPVKSSNLVFKRVRVGANEIDYIAEDVTIRHFETRTPPHRSATGYKQVNIGNDVTVRYFAPRTTIVSQSR
jgi:hypothetical protein